MREDQCVLIVDRSDEMHEVLEMALARRGVRTYHACGARHGLDLAERIHPDLIVLDLELEQADPEATCAPFALQSRRNETPLVVLGSARRAREDSPLSEFVRKPYDYGPLVRRIEELLVRAKTSGRRAA